MKEPEIFGGAAGICCKVRKNTLWEQRIAAVLAIHRNL